MIAGAWSGTGWSSRGLGDGDGWRASRAFVVFLPQQEWPRRSQLVRLRALPSASGHRGGCPHCVPDLPLKSGLRAAASRRCVKLACSLLYHPGPSSGDSSHSLRASRNVLRASDSRERPSDTSSRHCTEKVVGRRRLIHGPCTLTLQSGGRSFQGSPTFAVGKGTERLLREPHYDANVCSVPQR